MMFVWRKRGKISRTVVYYIEYGSFTQNVYTYMNSSYRPSCICMHFFVIFYTAYYLLYYCNMVMWSWWDWTTIFILQCCDTVGSVISPVRNLLLTGKKLAVKTVPEMTYNVSSGTLNSVLSCPLCSLQRCIFCAQWCVALFWLNAYF